MTTTIADIYQWKEILSDLQAQTPDVNGIYYDSSPKNNNWIQSNNAAQPSINNFTLSSGLNANSFYFNGSTNTYIKAYFNPPGWIENLNYNLPTPSETTIAIIADAANGASNATANQYVLFGGANVGVNQYLLGINNKKPVWFGPGHSSTLALVNPISLSNTNSSSPHLFIYSMSQTMQQMGLIIDGGSWNLLNLNTITLQSTGVPADSSLILGFSLAGVSAGWPKPWFGNIYRIMIFKESFLNPAKSTKLTQLQTFLSSTYGTP